MLEDEQESEIKRLKQEIKYLKNIETELIKVRKWLSEFYHSSCENCGKVHVKYADQDFCASCSDDIYATKRKRNHA
jgi:hypothetical protein